MAKKKNGPVTEEERQFVKTNMQMMSAQEMGEILGRNPETVVKIMGQSENMGYKSEILDLKKRADWKSVQEEFCEEEIEIFKAHWSGIVQQFSEEIHYTESLQIISAIKQLILSERILKDQQKIRTEVIRIAAEVEFERKQDPPNKDIILSLEQQLANYSMAEQVNGKEYREGSTKLMAIIKELKGTREQRMAKVEDMKTNFGVVMRNLIEDPKIKREWGAYMEKMRLAMEKEYWRLGLPHKYGNNEIDRPILNSETINFYQKEEKEEKEEDDEDDEIQTVEVG